MLLSKTSPESVKSEKYLGPVKQQQKRFHWADKGAKFLKQIKTKKISLAEAQRTQTF